MSEVEVEATERGTTFGQVVRISAALTTAGAGMLHLDAAGDHTDHPHVAAFFVVVAVVQLLWASAAARRECDQRTFAAGLLFNAGVLAIWVVSRTVGLPDLIPDVGGVEPIGMKDAAASGLAFAALAAGGIALSMPAAAAAALIAPRSSERILRAMAVATLAATIPGALVSHEHGDHGHDAAAHDDHAVADLTGAVEVHEHDGVAAGDHAALEHADASDTDEHVHAEVLEGDGHPAGTTHAGHTPGTTTLAAAHVADAAHGAHEGATADHGTAHEHAGAAVPAAAGVVDPLVGPGSVSTTRIGPFALLPTIPGMKTPHLSPAIPRIAPGELNLVPLVGVPPPCEDCYVLALQPDLVYLDGTPADLDTGPMLHHTVWADPSRSDPVCGAGSLVGILGHRVFASGNERTGFALPDGFGMPVGKGLWRGAVELMNTSNDLKLVYVQLTARWLPRSAPEIEPVTSVWLDIDSCGDSEVDIPAGVTDVGWDWASNITGRVITAGGHLHDGGKWLGLTNQTTGEHVCTSVAGYGADPSYLGSLDSMTTCVWDRLGVVRAGDVLHLNAHYNTTAPATGVMGIMVVFVHETDDLTAGRPSPYPAEPPPDGAPQAAPHQH
jgi:hypothetical protein